MSLVFELHGYNSQSSSEWAVANLTLCPDLEWLSRGTATFTSLPALMSYFLPHLPSGWHVDEAITSEEDRVVVIRFGHDWDSQCMTMDETLYSVAEKVQNFAVIYLVDITEVPDFNKVRRFVICS